MRLRRRHPYAALLLPYLLGAVALVGIPALVALVISLTRYNGMGAPSFAGWANFRQLSIEPLFWVAFANSFLFIAQAVPLRVLGALGLALLLNRDGRGTGFYRAAVYLPTVIPDVAYALAWTWILNPLYGPLNQLLQLLGLPAPAWLADARWALPAVVLMSLLQIGEGFIILLAGLRHIPRELYDAAQVDGAGRFRTFTWITLPLISPWLILVSVRDVVLSFQSSFTPAYIMTRGGPYYATFFAPLLVYEEAFENLRFGQSAAAMLLLLLLTLALIFLLYLVFEGWGFDED